MQACFFLVIVSLTSISNLHFNLIEILTDEVKKIQFLKELFHYQIRIE
jgi:hypothetical protein